MKIQLEKTDTFSGEANYSWVERFTIESEKELSDLAIVRKAKKWAGWNNIRSTTENHGDMIVIKPRGMGQIMFITFE